MEKRQGFLLGIVLLYSLAASISGVYLPLFYLSRGLSIQEIIFLLCTTFAILVAVPIFVSGKNTISWGLLLFSLFHFSASFAPPVVVGILYGLGLAFFWPSLNFISAKLTSSEDRAGFLGKISAVRTTAPIFGVLFGGFAASVFGLGSLMYFSGALFLASFFISTALFSDLPSEKLNISELGKIPLREKNFLLFSAGFFLNGFADSTWLVYPLFLSMLSSGKTSEIGIASSAITLLSAAVFLAIGKISDISGKRKIFLALSAPFEFIWFFGVSVAKSIAGVVGLSVFSSIASGLMRTGDSLYLDCFEKKHHAFMTAIRESMLNLGRIASILLLSQAIISESYFFYYRILATVSLFYIPIYLLVSERHSYA